MPVDIRLIDPTRDQLAATLRRAHVAANRALLGNRFGRLERDAAFWRRFAQDCLRERAGRRRSCKGGFQTPEVIAGWWTDPANRKHFRVIGRARSPYHYNRPRREGELRDLPPWWQVYPESVLAVRRPGGETYLACCRCGAVGTPESLGWMGDTCGPCFDRRADGGTTAGGFGHFPGWAGYHSRVGFSADCTELIGHSLGNRLRRVNRADGTEVLGKTTFNTVAAVVGLPDGHLIEYADGTVTRWTGDGTPTPLVKRTGLYGRVCLAPNGRRAFVSAANVGYTADLTEAVPRYRRVEGLRALAVARFTPTGDRIIGVSFLNELIELNPVTLAERVLRPDVFGGLYQYPYAQDLVVAPDASTVAVARESDGLPGGGTTLVPLGPGPTRYLPQPYGHNASALAFSPDGEYLATADTRTGWVGFWRLKAGKAVGFVRAVPEDPSLGGGQVLFAPDGRAVAILCTGHHAERGSTVVVWPWPEVLRAAGSG
jgi:hypothetical protein